MFESGKALTNGVKLWFGAIAGFIFLAVSAIACTNPYLSAATMKLLLPVWLVTYPLGFAVGWRYASRIVDWMERT